MLKHLAAAAVIGAGLILLDRIGFSFTMGTIHAEPEIAVLTSRYDEDADDHAPTIH